MFNEIILATNNTGKIAELTAILSPMQCISQQIMGIESPEETGLSFIENAILKARHSSRYSNKPALADDSGLVVDALNGQPGIYSARFAGPSAKDQDNIALLLEKMAHLDGEHRHAYFYCAIALVQHADDPTPLIATGRCFGEITKAPQGDNGFGYDPVFYRPDYKCTFAELSAAIKNTISHRAKALMQLHDMLHAMD